MSHRTAHRQSVHACRWAAACQPVATVHTADIIGTGRQSWPPPRAPKAGKPSANVLLHERSLSLAIAGGLLADARTPPARPAAPVGADAKKARTRASCHSTSARTVAAPESETFWSQRKCFSLTPLHHQLPATSRLTVFFSHITSATSSSSSPANRVRKA